MVAQVSGDQKIMVINHHENSARFPLVGKHFPSDRKKESASFLSHPCEKTLQFTKQFYTPCLIYTLRACELRQVLQWHSRHKFCLEFYGR